MLKMLTTIVCTGAVFLALQAADYFFFPIALALGAGFGFAALILMGAPDFDRGE